MHTVMMAIVQWNGPAYIDELGSRVVVGTIYSGGESLARGNTTMAWCKPASHASSHHFRYGSLAHRHRRIIDLWSARP